MASIQDVYGHLKTLTKKWFYDKTEVDNKLSNKESTSNKTTTLSSSSTNTQYPSAKAVFDAIQNAEINSGSGESGSSNLDLDYYFDATTKELVIEYEGGISGTSSNNGTNITIDNTWVTNSTNPVESQLIQTALNNKSDTGHTHSQYLTSHQSLTNYIQKSSTVGLIKNDGTIDTSTYLTSHQSLSNYIQKSSTTGLIKNNGTIDTNSYSLSTHNHSGTYANATHNHDINNLNNVSTVDVVVTYTDNTTETIKLMKYTGS